MRIGRSLLAFVMVGTAALALGGRAEALAPLALPVAVGGAQANVLAVDRSGRTVVVAPAANGSSGAARVDRLTGATVSVPPFKAVSADGSAVITTDNRWLDIATGTALAVPERSTFTTYALSADGRTYAAGGPVATAGWVVDGATQKRTAIPVAGIPERISPNGQFVLVATTCSTANTVTSCDYVRWDRTTGFAEPVVRATANETLIAGVANNGRVVVAVSTTATTAATYVLKQAGLRNRTLTTQQTGTFLVGGGELSADGSTYGWSYSPTACCGSFVVAHLDDATLAPDEVNVWTNQLDPAAPIGVLARTTHLSGDGSQVVYLAVTPPTTFLIGKAVPHTTSTPRLRAGEVLAVPVAGRAGIDAAAGAVVLNATVTNPAGPGFLTVWPCGQARPGTSTLNFPAGGTVANAAVTTIGTGGTVCVSSSVDADVVLDANGWSLPGNFIPVGPARLVDTRNGENDTVGNVPAGQQTVVSLAGAVGVPAGAAAAVLNVTITNPSGPGFATVWPCGGPRPLASNVNFVAGQTVAAAAISALSADRTVCVSSNATLDVVVDIAGYLAPTSTYVPRVPSRLIDTRNGQEDTTPNTPAATVVTITVPTGNEAVVVNATVTNPVADGFLVVWPCGQPVPTASTLNFAKGQTVANAAVVAVGTGNTICAQSNVAVDVVADLQGGFSTGSPFEPMQPARLLDSRA